MGLIEKENEWFNNKEYTKSITFNYSIYYLFYTINKKRIETIKIKSGKVMQHVIYTEPGLRFAQMEGIEINYK